MKVLQAFNFGCRPVRTTIVDDQDVEIGLQAQHLFDDGLNILNFVVRRDNDDSIAHVAALDDENNSSNDHSPCQRPA